MGKLEDNIFRLNTTLLSAFGLDADESKSFIEENDRLYSKVNTQLQKEYNFIKSGSKFGLQPDPEPTKESAEKTFAEGNIPKAFIDFAALRKKYPNDIKILKRLAQTLIVLNSCTSIKKYLLKDLEKHSDDLEVKQLIGEYYMKNDTEESYKKAVPVFSELAKTKKDFPILFQLSYAYERAYQDKYLDKAMKLAEESLKYANEYESEVAYIQLAKNHADLGHIDIALDYLSKVKTEANRHDGEFFKSYVYLRNGQIKEAYDYYRVRFDAHKTEYPLTLTADKRATTIDQIKGSNILIHYEQGFGDSVMFARYVKIASRIAKKVYFVCPNSMYTLFIDSGFNDFCEVLPPNKNKTGKKQSMSLQGHEFNDIDFDYHIPLMDTPYVLNITKDDIGYPEGFLSVKKEDIEAFGKKHINQNNKLKIGIAYHGTKSSNQTYRDIPAKEFIPLLEMDNVELYSFQLDEHSAEVTKLMKKYKNLYSFKHSFNSFKDTACAIGNMDLMLTTDNVIMNLSGALGAKTYGIFNVYSEPRWYKTKGDDIGWYKSVRPFQAKTFNDWGNLIQEIKASIIKEFKL